MTDTIYKVRGTTAQLPHWIVVETEGEDVGREPLGLNLELAPGFTSQVPFTSLPLLRFLFDRMKGLSVVDLKGPFQL